ncbi:folate-binding protein YgfZ [Alphaproteobacteria bacterium KMM 3653]|uniref:Folate-binding protein YgfZ n=1 Tax=Harenicola maris TaxID=2841044 RepID=A0AAP2GA74_9RHOB|nr:folate-binding protein YgfZ [Harenicola maris]
MTDRTILKLTGADRQSFLQGLVTNDVQSTDSGLIYAALLTPQGKYLADFFILNRAEDTLIDVDASLAEGLAKRLMMYRLRADVQIEVSDLKVFRGTGPAGDGDLQDPRHPALGWRRYGAEAGDDGSDWDQLRVEHLIPMTGVELVPNETYILEAGFEALHGVDFRKGCYVGQEVTARMKHKTELKKGLAPVKVQGEAPIGTVITAGEKPAGTLYTQAGGAGIAYLRFDRAVGEMTAGDAAVTRK